MKLRTLCRKWYQRRFDKGRLSWFYINHKEKTSSWVKPLVMGNEDLVPFPTPDECHYRISGLYHMWVAREGARFTIRREFEKIYDIVSRKFYYFYKGKSLLMPIAKWKKPYLLHPFDLFPVFTRDVAALIIQKQWRVYATRIFLKQLCRREFRREWDPINGRNLYRHRTNTKLTIPHKPLLLRGDLWDPREFWEWDNSQVQLFLRRLGLKHLLHDFQVFGVDGAMMAILEEEDYFNLGVTNRIHMLKIIYALESLNPVEKRPRPAPIDKHRVNKIRLHRRYEKASLILQCWWRQQLSKIEVLRRIDQIRVAGIEEEVKMEVKKSMIWWHERDGALDNNPNNMLFAPKTWGRRPDYLSARGWGHWDGEEWVEGMRHSDMSSSNNPQNEWNDVHPSYNWSKKLEENRKFQVPFSSTKYKNRMK